MALTLRVHYGCTALTCSLGSSTGCL